MLLVDGGFVQWRELVNKECLQASLCSLSLSLSLYLCLSLSLSVSLCLSLSLPDDELLKGSSIYPPPHRHQEGVPDCYIYILLSYLDARMEMTSVAGGRIR